MFHLHSSFKAGKKVHHFTYLKFWQVRPFIFFRKSLLSQLQVPQSEFFLSKKNLNHIGQWKCRPQQWIVITLMNRGITSKESKKSYIQGLKLSKEQLSPFVKRIKKKESWKNKRGDVTKLLYLSGFELCKEGLKKVEKIGGFFHFKKQSVFHRKKRKKSNKYLVTVIICQKEVTQEKKRKKKR